MTADLLTGAAAAATIVALGFLSVRGGTTAEGAETVIHSFGTLVTLLCGIVSALWWHQSAALSDRLIDRSPPDPRAQRDANALNAAAATFTGLALLASVFAGLRWRSPGSWLCLVGFVALLTMSGGDLRQAMPISLRQRLGLRAVLSLLTGAVAVAVFVMA